MRRAFTVLALVVAIVTVGAMAVAATLNVNLNTGDTAVASCPSGSISWHKVDTHNGSVRCKATPTPTPTPSPSPTVSPSPTDTPDPTPSPTDTPTTASPSPTSAGGWACTTSDQHGRCGSAWDANSGPWCNSTQVQDGVVAGQGTNGGCVYTDQNEWSPLAGEQQTLNANGPSDWEIVSNTPRNSSGSVTTFPNTGAEFNEQPLSSYSTVQATVDESMPHNAGTSGWAMMDDWFNGWKYEVMIQHDFTNNGPCDYVAVQAFAGNTWGLCAFGTKTDLKANGGAFAWKLAPATATVGSSATINQPNITIDIKAMVQYLADNGWMDTPTVTNLSDGWEICSTGGTAETFKVNSYTLTAQ